MLRVTGEDRRSFPDQFRSAISLAQFLVYILVLQIAIQAAALFSGTRQLLLILDLKAGRPIARQAVESADRWTNMIGLPHILVSVLVAVLFLVWVYRARRNIAFLRIDGIDPAPGMSVGWFFIPFANFYKPYQVVRELWETSEVPANPAADFTWGQEPIPAMLKLWWAATLIVGVLNQVSRILNQGIANAKTIDPFVKAAGARVGTLLVVLALSGLMLWVVLRITRRQAERFVALRDRESQPAQL